MKRCACGTSFILEHSSGTDLDKICLTCINRVKIATCIECNKEYNIFPFHDKFHADWSHWICNDCLDEEEISIEIVHDYVPNVCPITMDPLGESARRSKKCHHMYSNDGIEWHISNGRKTCPVAGCQQKIKKSDLT